MSDTKTITELGSEKNNVVLECLSLIIGFVKPPLDLQCIFLTINKINGTDCEVLLYIRNGLRPRLSQTNTVKSSPDTAAWLHYQESKMASRQAQQRNVNILHELVTRRVITPTEESITITWMVN